MSGSKLPTDKDGSPLDLIRDLVVQAGLDVIDRDGLGLRAEAITYSKVFAYIEDEYGIRVTRGSVHERIWANQDEFRYDVLAEAATHRLPFDPSRRVNRVLIESIAAANDVDAGFTMRVRSFVRPFSNSLLDSYLQSEGYRQFQATKAAVRTGDDTATAGIRQLVDDRLRHADDARTARYRTIIHALGMGGRRSLGLSDDAANDLYSTLLHVLVSGAHLDHWAGFDGISETCEIGDDPDGGSPWTGFSLAALGCVQMLYEANDSIDQAAAAAKVSSFDAREDSLDTENDGWDWSSDGRARRSRAELRRLVTTAGVEVFLRDGLLLKPETLSYASVFDNVRKTKGIIVHRSTVHPRIWSNQDDFRHEVLAEAARRASHEVTIKIGQEAGATVTAHNDDGSINRRQTMLDSVLSATVALCHLAIHSRSFARWQSIKASSMTQAPDAERHRHELGEAVCQQFDTLLPPLAAMFGKWFDELGYGVRPEFEMDNDEALYTLAVICITYLAGLEFNVAAGSALSARTVALPRVDGTDRVDDWPVVGVGVRAAIELLFDIRPD